MSNTTHTVLTGDRPTGRLHLGHYVGSIQNRIKLQEQYERCFYMVADIQALTDNADKPEKVRQNAFEVAIDNLAVGLSPDKTTFFLQSQIPEIAELTVLFLNLVSLARLRRNPTVKDEMKQKGFGENVPAGFLTYPVSQAADMLFPGGIMHIPVGEDQLPVIEQANEIVRKFNNNYGQTFHKIKPILSDIPRLTGIDGNSKASKSLNNAIYLSDSTDEVRSKVSAMYTDPRHIRASDPGKVEGNVVFNYLDAFDRDQSGLQTLKENYRRGGVGDEAVKERLIAVLEDLLEPIRERRREFETNPSYVEQILRIGTQQTRQAAQETMQSVKRVVKIDYFNGDLA